MHTHLAAPLAVCGCLPPLAGGDRFLLAHLFVRCGAAGPKLAKSNASPQNHKHTTADFTPARRSMAAPGSPSTSDIKKACRKFGVSNAGEIAAIVNACTTPLEKKHDAFYDAYIKDAKLAFVWGCMRLAQVFACRDRHNWKYFQGSQRVSAGCPAPEAALRELVYHFVSLYWALVYVLAQQGSWEAMHTMFELQFVDPESGQVAAVMPHMQHSQQFSSVATSIYRSLRSSSSTSAEKADAATYLYEYMALHATAKRSCIQQMMYHLLVAQGSRQDDVQLLDAFVRLGRKQPHCAALAPPLTRDDNAVLRTALAAGSLRVVNYLLSLGSEYGVDAWALSGQGIMAAAQRGHVEVLRCVLKQLKGGVLAATPPSRAQPTNSVAGTSVSCRRQAALPWRRGLLRVLCGRGASCPAVRELACVPGALLFDGVGMPGALLEYTTGQGQMASARQVHGVSVWRGGVCRGARRVLLLHRARGRG